MFDHTHYVPLLRAKDAEWIALANLPQQVRRRLTPMMELTPRALQKKPAQARRNARSTAEHALRTFWDRVGEQGERGRVFVDLGLLGEKPVVAGARSWEFIGNRLTLMPSVVPVVSAPVVSAGIRHDITQILRKTRSGVCMRVTVASHMGRLGAIIESTARAMNLPPESIDLVLDLGREPRRLTHDQMRHELKELERWRSWTVLSGVFPENLTQLRSDQLEHRLVREEWLTWRVQAESENVGRTPTFGDFTIQHGEFVESPEVPGSLSVRYTLDGAWLVLRGRQANSEQGVTHEQFHGHARHLLRHPDFYGATFSAGDAFMASKTSASTTPGNANQWLAAGINHHLTVVADQLVAFDPSSGHVRVGAPSRG